MSRIEKKIADLLDELIAVAKSAALSGSMSGEESAYAKQDLIDTRLAVHKKLRDAIEPGGSGIVTGIQMAADVRVRMGNVPHCFRQDPYGNDEAAYTRGWKNAIKAKNKAIVSLYQEK